MTSLEHLPDELWLEIFSYIAYVHLFPSFVGLNARINTVLPMNIRLQCKTDVSYERSKILIEASPDYITSLSVDYYDQDIDLSPLRNLVSLRLGHATDRQLTLIRSNHFKHLNQLTIIVCSIRYPLGDILFGENQLHGLTTCRLPTLDSYFHRYKSYRSCLTLQSLHLNYCHTNTFRQALQFLPNLVQFESSIVPLPLKDQFVDHPSMKHPTLTCLELVLRTNVTLTDLEWMLIHVPDLEQLDLSMTRPNLYQEAFDLVELANLLNDRVQKMKQCNIKINLSSSCIQLNHDDLSKLIYH